MSLNDDLEMNLIIEMNRTCEFRSQIDKEIDEINSYILKYDSYEKSEVYDTLSFPKALSLNSKHMEFDIIPEEKENRKIINEFDVEIEHKEDINHIEILPKFMNKSGVLVPAINYIEQSDLLYGYIEFKEKNSRDELLQDDLEVFEFLLCIILNFVL